MKTTPAHLLELFRGERALHILLEANDRPVEVHVDLTPRIQAALPLVFAVLGHQPPGCKGGLDVAVGLLLRTAAALGADPACLVIRPAPSPAFWLRLVTPDGPHEVDVDVLDAFALLVSRRLPIEVTRNDATDWDGALTDLLDGR